MMLGSSPRCHLILDVARASAYDARCVADRRQRPPAVLSFGDLRRFIFCHAALLPRTASKTPPPDAPTLPATIQPVLSTPAARYRERLISSPYDS